MAEITIITTTRNRSRAGKTTGENLMNTLTELADADGFEILTPGVKLTRDKKFAFSAKDFGKLETGESITIEFLYEYNDVIFGETAPEYEGSYRARNQRQADLIFDIIDQSRMSRFQWTEERRNITSSEPELFPSGVHMRDRFYSPAELGI